VTILVAAAIEEESGILLPHDCDELIHDPAVHSGPFMLGLLAEPGNGDVRQGAGRERKQGVGQCHFESGGGTEPAAAGNISLEGKVCPFRGKAFCMQKRDYALCVVRP
jgi:hypothetical protein